MVDHSDPATHLFYPIVCPGIQDRPPKLRAMLGRCLQLEPNLPRHPLPKDSYWTTRDLGLPEPHESQVPKALFSGGLQHEERLGTLEMELRPINWFHLNVVVPNSTHVVGPVGAKCDDVLLAEA